MKCKKIKIIGSNNKYLPLGDEYCGDLIANKLIVNSRIEHHLSSEKADTGLVYNRWELRHQDYRKELTLDIKNVTIYAQHVHVDAWFVDEESNGGRVEMELYWK